MRVAFVVNDLALSGGIGVIVQHARQLLHHGIQAHLVLAREQEEETWRYDSLVHLDAVMQQLARVLDDDADPAREGEVVDDERDPHEAPPGGSAPPERGSPSRSSRSWMYRRKSSRSSMTCSRSFWDCT